MHWCTWHKLNPFFTMYSKLNWCLAIQIVINLKCRKGTFLKDLLMRLLPHQFIYWANHFLSRFWVSIKSTPWCREKIERMEDHFWQGLEFVTAANLQCLDVGALCSLDMWDLKVRWRVEIWDCWVVNSLMKMTPHFYIILQSLTNLHMQAHANHTPS